MAASSALGRSLLLRDGDLVLAGGRFVEVSGVANLVQALTLRVLTPLGDDRFNTAYGFDAAGVFAAAASARTARDLVQLNLVRTLGTDPRVAEVREVRFLEPPDSRRRAWPVEVTVITTATAQRGQQAVTVPLRVGA